MQECQSIPCVDFFLSLTLIFILSACGNQENKPPLVLGWENNRAVSVSISKSIVSEIPDDSLQSIQITVGDSLNQSMLGEWSNKGNNFIFNPIVPFTRGNQYHVIYREKIIGEFNVPFNPDSKKPTLSIYPSQDTLPENILKMYFHFSEPMVEGQSLGHIYLQNKNGDTLSGIFLELLPELWNDEGTLLTLWFDPGRIKRDLIPNQQMGNPLQDGEAYTLHVSGKWKSKNGFVIAVEPEGQILRLGDLRVPFTLQAGETVELRIFLDKSMVEVFANDRQAAVAVHKHRNEDKGVTLFSNGGETTVLKALSWKMKSIYP